ncbi:MAG TPA: hypothetical protein ENL06_00165 [Candidatus Portnoybacteria bacterium]|nr:hypothetical protein [Candidatus Portnoybacteria bacterium]
MKYQEKPDITLKDIINSGFIKPNISVYASINENILGKINIEGAIEIKIDGIKKVFPFPSGAARAFTKTSVNGWKFWKIYYNDEFIELAELKRKYLTK